MPSARPLTRVLEFLRTEAASGVLLVGAAGVALIWANVAAASYTDLFATEVSLPGPDHALTIRDWINDGLMAVFFFVVGLEIKREIVDGELRDPRAALVPAVAAIGGMIVPIAIFLAIAGGGDYRDGWGVPMATDIAFAVGVLRLTRPRAPTGLGTTLLTLAIVDDLGAILVIAIAYSGGIQWEWLVAAAATVLVIRVMERGLDHPAWYILPAVVLWILTQNSGVHATIAGVVLGFATPVRTRRGREVLAALEHRIHPWTSFVVLPIFALANAGIPIGGDQLADLISSSLAWGIAAGLVVGKVVGIAAGVFVAVKLGGRLPAGVNRRGIIGIGFLGGIGFTVALFVADLAFTGAALGTAKLAILVSSFVAAGLGAIVLRSVPDGSDAAA